MFTDNFNREETSISVIDAIQDEPLDLGALNNTARARHEVLFFNRVPKVGSQTFMELMRHLSVRNGFGFHRDHIQRVETIRLPSQEQVNYWASGSIGNEFGFHREIRTRYIILRRHLQHVETIKLPRQEQVILEQTYGDLTDCFDLSNMTL